MPIPRWQLIANLALAALYAWFADEPDPAAVEVHGAFIGALVGAVVGAFAWLADKAVTIGAILWQVTVLIGQAIARLAIEVGVVFVKVLAFIRDFWSGVLRPFVTWAWDAIRRLAGWLERTFRPVIDFLIKVRREILKYYERFVRPVLETIGIARRILQLLSRIGVDWAKELDAKLAQLEDRILAPIRFALAKINEVIDVVNRIVTLDGYLQRITLIASLIRYQADALKVWWSSVHRPLAGAKRSEYEKPLAGRSIDAVAADYREYVLEGRGPDAARIDEHALDYALRLRSL